MKNFIYYFLVAVVFISIGWFANFAYHLPRNSNPIAAVRPTPLAKYTIENLSKISVAPSEIQIGKVIKDNPNFTSYEFTFSFDPKFANGPEKTVSGLINIPKGDGAFPVIVMFRGYVDQTKYFIGEGTQHAAEIFAKNGYITIAPDFLGYGDSSQESFDTFESRFQTYTTAMETLKSVEALKEAPLKVGSNTIKTDGNIFIWAHSNGGQIALTTLEITGVTYPTVLWAPVSKPFPYSILYYLDESPDSGKYIITHLADFMADYDVTKYSLTNYIGNIKAEIQLNQGTNDDAVPFTWSDALDKEFKDATVSASLIKYPGADHNMQPTWSVTVANNLKFFNDHLVK